MVDSALETANIVTGTVAARGQDGAFEQHPLARFVVHPDIVNQIGNGRGSGRIANFGLLGAHKAAELLLHAIVVAVAIVIVDQIIIAAIGILYRYAVDDLHRKGQIDRPRLLGIPVGNVIFNRGFVGDLDRAPQAVVHGAQQEGLFARRKVNITQTLTAAEE